MTNLFFSFLFLFFFPLFLSAQDTVPKSLIKLSKTLESKSISSRIVTNNVKATRIAKKKKRPTKKNQPTKNITKIPIIATNNVTETDTALDQEIRALTHSIILPTANIEPKVPTENVTPWLHLGASLSHLPLPKSRINPSSTISSWLSGYIKFSFIEVSAGYSRFSENDVPGSLAFTPSNTESYYAHIMALHPLKPRLWMTVGYLVIKTDGMLAYAQLNKATIDGIYIGLQHELSKDLALSVGWFPKMNNTYTLDNIDSEKLPARFHPETSFSTSMDYGVFVFSLKYDIFSF